MLPSAENFFIALQFTARTRFPWLFPSMKSILV
jgi:hypothetical protein